MIIFRIIGALVGGHLGGFWFGVFGFFLGRMLDNAIAARRGGSRRTVFSSHYYNGLSQNEFVDTLMQLTAVVIKSDDKMLKSELDYVKQYLIKNLGTRQAQNAVLNLRDYLKQNIDSEQLCRKLSQNASLQERLLILQFLFGLAKADGNVDNSEVQTIQMIASWMGIPSATFESLKAMFLGYGYYSGYQQQGFGYGGGYSSEGSSYSSTSYNFDEDYKILEISPDASDEEVKKAFRKAAMKHHPDRVSHLGEEARKAAEEKFAKVNEAYNRIKKSRGIN